MIRPPIASRAVATIVVALLLAGAEPSGAQEKSAPSAPPAGNSIIPRREPLAPRAFTLEDRYLDAAHRGDLETLKVCLEKGVNLHSKDDFGRSALLLAAMNGHNLEMIEFLHARGLPVDEPDNQSRAPLAYASGKGDVAIVSYLLEQGALVGRKDWQGQTPLFNATVTGDKPTIERLLVAGADIDARDAFGDTSLIAACAKGNDAVARMLVERGADPAIKDQEGRTARERAAENAEFCRQLPSAKAVK